MSVQILIGDVRERLAGLADNSVDCVVTSPPYWGLRDYGVAGQLGLEPTYHEHVVVMVAVFEEVRRILKPEGTLWLNYGDSYATSVNGRSAADTKAAGNDDRTFRDKPFSTVQGALKAKDLCGIPWRVAFGLQDAGWYLRQDIIWSKPNPMPESVRDRCTKAHEYLFLMSKSQRYYFDAESIAEPVALSTISRLAQDVESQTGSDRVPGKTNGAMKAVGRDSWKGSRFDKGKTAEHQLGRSQSEDSRTLGAKGQETPDEARSSAGARMGRGAGWRNDPANTPSKRNKRSVWEVATQPFSEAHFATFPPDLIEPCILAGCPKGGLVLDPFGGAGTTGLVADRLGRNAILIELNPEYAEIAQRRLADDGGMFADVQVAA